MNNPPSVAAAGLASVSEDASERELLNNIQNLDERIRLTTGLLAAAVFVKAMGCAECYLPECDSCDWDSI